MEMTEWTNLARLGLALIFTLSLIGLFGLLLKRFGGGLAGAGKTGNRLDVVEWKALDVRHRLVLVRRDRQEHLILLSQNAAPLLVESGITRVESNPPAAPIGPAR